MAHLILDELHCLLRCHAPVGRASGQNFDNRKSLFCLFVFKCLADCLLSLPNVRNAVYSNTLCQCNTRQGGHHFTNPNWVTSILRISTVWGCLCNLSRHGSRCHLTASHTISRVIDKDNDQIFPTCSAVYGFRRTNCGKVAVALISKDHLVRIGTLHTGCNCRSSAVRCFDDITSKIIIGHNGTSNRYNPDGVSLNAHFIQYFADQTMHNPVPTARAEMHRHVQQCFRPFKYHCHYSAPPASFFNSARTSPGVGMTPPVLPKNETGMRHSVANRTSSTI